MMSRAANRSQRIRTWLGTALLFLVTSLSAMAVLLIFVFIFKDMYPFFIAEKGGFNFGAFREFFASPSWYPTGHPPVFGSLSLFVGTALVTVGASLIAVPLGVAAAVCLSDVLPFKARQLIKPVIEMLAAIPSVAYGFFALVVFAPILQERGGHLLGTALWVIGAPLLGLGAFVAADVFADRFQGAAEKVARWGGTFVLGCAGAWVLRLGAGHLGAVEVSSGTNAFNVSVILGIMALPTVVSVSEDALQAVGRELREGSYALGATRAETITRTVIPAAISGICAAVILGVMRAVGETMVVWMASGNAAQIPSPLFNYMMPIRTLTATIAGDMGEADHTLGSMRYHVLFVMAFCLLVFSFVMNLASEWVIRRQRIRLGKE